MKSIRDLYRIGPGPSSSHTIAPMRACKYVLDKYKEATSFVVTLYGSLALTGKGHGTDEIIENVLGKDKTQIIFDIKTKTEHINYFTIKVFNNNNLIKEEKFISLGGGALEIIGEPLTEEKEIYPFADFDSIKKYIKENKLSLTDFVYKFEDEDIKEYLKQIYSVMKDSILRGLSKTGELPGGLHVQRKAKFLSKDIPNEKPEFKFNRIVSSYAYAVSEENATHGILATAPTCGACGVIPAVLYYFEQNNHCNIDKIIDALAVAGLFGTIIKQNAFIAGSLGGCQAEIGSACAMGSAAYCYLLGGSIEEIESAAEMAIEHHLGLTCDPINGLVQIPCIERNAAAAVRAIMGADLAMLVKGTQVISFDTIVKTMKETGKDLNWQYKETSLGGLAKEYKK